MTRAFSSIAIYSLLFALCGCGQDVANEAAKAEREGRIISNEMMSSFYPASFQVGDPPYLERDFEAGANFICDEIMRKRQRDICAEADINWR